MYSSGPKLTFDMTVVKPSNPQTLKSSNPLKSPTPKTTKILTQFEHTAKSHYSRYILFCYSYKSAVSKAFSDFLAMYVSASDRKPVVNPLTAHPDSNDYCYVDNLPPKVRRLPQSATSAADNPGYDPEPLYNDINQCAADDHIYTKTGDTTTDYYHQADNDVNLLQTENQYQLADDHEGIDRTENSVVPSAPELTLPRYGNSSKPETNAESTLQARADNSTESEDNNYFTLENTTADGRTADATAEINGDEADGYVDLSKLHTEHLPK